MAPHALHPPGCIQFREQAYDHALSLPTGAPNGKPMSYRMLLRAQGRFADSERVISPVAGEGDGTAVGGTVVHTGKYSFMPQNLDAAGDWTIVTVIPSPLCSLTIKRRLSSTPRRSRGL